MKVLLIESDRVLARTYAAYLRQNGCEVGLAADAQSAVHALDSFQPELIVLELQLVRHNGIEFLYELRSYADWQEIPVIAHTMLAPGNVNLSADVLAALGVVQYLYKPATSLERLGRVVREVLQPAAT